MFASGGNMYRQADTGTGVRPISDKKKKKAHRVMNSKSHIIKAARPTYLMIQNLE